jgi:hypothetical protein
MGRPAKSDPESLKGSRKQPKPCTLQGVPVGNEMSAALQPPQRRDSGLPQGRPELDKGALTDGSTSAHCWGNAQCQVSLSRLDRSFGHAASTRGSRAVQVY